MKDVKFKSHNMNIYSKKRIEEFYTDSKVHQPRYWNWVSKCSNEQRKNESIKLTYLTMKLSKFSAETMMKNI